MKKKLTFNIKAALFQI